MGLVYEGFIDSLKRAIKHPISHHKSPIKYYIKDFHFPKRKNPHHFPRLSKFPHLSRLPHKPISKKELEFIEKIKKERPDIYRCAIQMKTFSPTTLAQRIRMCLKRKESKHKYSIPNIFGHRKPFNLSHSISSSLTYSLDLIRPAKSSYFLLTEEQRKLAKKLSKLPHETISKGEQEFIEKIKKERPDIYRCAIQMKTFSPTTLAQRIRMCLKRKESKHKYSIPNIFGHRKPVVTTSVSVITSATPKITATTTAAVTTTATTKTTDTTTTTKATDITTTTKATHSSFTPKSKHTELKNLALIGGLGALLMFVLNKD